MANLGAAGRDALAVLPAGTTVTLGIEVGPDGVARCTGLPPAFAQAARAAGLQLRVELIADGYEKRHVDFAKIHGVKQEDLTLLAEALGLREGARVLDLGCGYGEVSASILDEAKRRGIGVQLTMCDLHPAQLASIPPELSARAAQVEVGDARALPFAAESFDAVVIKMMLHEVPVWDQPIVCAEVLRVLKPGGAFVVWGVMPADGAQQDVFNKIMQVKNVLSGYESLVRDRYFFRLDQLLAMLREAGFREAHELRQVHFRQSTLARRDSELGGSEDKLAALNAY